VKDGEAKV